MSNPPFSFDFGHTASHFVANDHSRENQALKEKLRAAVNGEGKTRSELNQMVRQLDHLRSAELAAQRVRQEAEARARTADACFKERDKQFKQLLKAKNMDDIYEEISGWEERHRELEELNRELNDQNSQLKEDAQNKEEEVRGYQAQVRDYERQLELKDSELSIVRGTLDRKKDELDEQTRAKADVDSHLLNAYRAAEAQEANNRTLTKANQDAENHLREAQFQFASLHQQWQEAQQKLTQMEAAVNHLNDLEQINTNLEKEIETLRIEMETEKRTIKIKDDRISSLEQQFQKALERGYTAEAAFQAATEANAASPTEPQIVTTAGESLATELADLSDYEGSVYEQLEYSSIVEITDISPIEPSKSPEFTIGAIHTTSVTPIDIASPQLTVGTIQATSVTPSEVASPKLTVGTIQATSVPPSEVVSPQLKCGHIKSISVPPSEVTSPQLRFGHIMSISVQPVIPAKRKVATSSAQTTSPELTASLIESATISMAPVEPWEIVTVTSSTQTTAAPKQIAFGTQTDTLQPTETITKKQQLHLAPVIVTLDQPSHASTAPSKAITVSSGTQTSKPVEKPKETVPIVVTQKKHQSPSTISYTVYFLLAVLVGLLSILWLKQYNEVQAYRNANGHQQGYNMYNRGGAYGNGRYIFDLFPVAMDEGSSWLSQKFARGASKVITSIEAWAGATPTPMF